MRRCRCWCCRIFITVLKDAGFEPYDVGVMGELDVRMTAELFGGASAGRGAGTGVGRRDLLRRAEEGCDAGGEGHGGLAGADVFVAVEE